MFVNVKFDLALGGQLVIPASGVYQSGTCEIAFIDHGDGHFEPREIEAGVRAGDDFVVTKGLKAGDRAVTTSQGSKYNSRQAHRRQWRTPIN